MRTPVFSTELKDRHGRRVRVVMNDDGGLFLSRGVVDMELPAEETINLVRWLLWHGLHGRWAPPRTTTPNE